MWQLPGLLPLHGRQCLETIEEHWHDAAVVFVVVEDSLTPGRDSVVCRRSRPARG